LFDGWAKIAVQNKKHDISVKEKTEVLTEKTTDFYLVGITKEVPKLEQKAINHAVFVVLHERMTKAGTMFIYCECASIKLYNEDKGKPFAKVKIAHNKFTDEDLYPGHPLAKPC
jgi:hypothetical protein